jgi:hypothetical protein
MKFGWRPKEIPEDKDEKDSEKPPVPITLKVPDHQNIKYE